MLIFSNDSQIDLLSRPIDIDKLLKRTSPVSVDEMISPSSPNKKNIGGRNKRKTNKRKTNKRKTNK